MQEILILATILLPIITGVTQLVKQNVPMPKNVVPFVSLAVGLIIGAIAIPFTDLDLVLRLWSGGLAGLAGTGLYELALNPRQGSTKN